MDCTRSETIDPLRESFRRDGVVRVRSFFSEDVVGEIRDALQRYEREVVPTLPREDYTLEPDGHTVRNFWRMAAHDAFFRELASRPEIIALAGAFLQSSPEALSVETFQKPARVGSEVPHHQDNAYFCLSPPDVLTVWIPLDRVTAENGAVEYLLGSHRELLPHAPSGVKGNSFGLASAPAADAFETFVGLLEPGDVLVHHGLVIHKSPPNRSDSPRRSTVIVYRGADAERDPALVAAYEAALALTPQGG